MKQIPEQELISAELYQEYLIARAEQNPSQINLFRIWEHTLVIKEIKERVNNLILWEKQ